MEQRKYNVTLEGRPWVGTEADERSAELPVTLQFVEGRFHASEGDWLAMLAALLEQCGAAAAVRIGDPAVWREAVRVVGLEQRRALTDTSEPVMGRDILAGMPFNDDPTLGEISPRLPPNPNLPSFLDAERRRRPGGDDDPND